MNIKPFHREYQEIERRQQTQEASSQTTAFHKEFKKSNRDY